jgi:hypothetical protein
MIMRTAMITITIITIMITAIIMPTQADGRPSSCLLVMPGLVPGIHVLLQ